MHAHWLPTSPSGGAHSDHALSSCQAMTDHTGRPIDVRVQEDAQQFLLRLFDRLEPVTTVRVLDHASNRHFLACRGLSHPFFSSDAVVPPTHVTLGGA